MWQLFTHMDAVDVVGIVLFNGSVSEININTGIHSQRLWSSKEFKGAPTRAKVSLINVVLLS